MPRSWLGSAFLVVVAGLAASCSRGTFDGPDGVILDAQPRFAVRGRIAAQTIAIRGDDTHWAAEGISAEDISFGEGVEITRIAVANDRYMEVDVQVLPDAQIGYRDIVVGDLPFNGIFRVADPFRVVGGTPIKPGRFFRTIIEGTETQWIDGVEVSTDSDQVKLDGTYLPLGEEPLITDVINERYLELTGYAHWYAFNGTGGEIDLLIGLGPVEERDLGVGTLEVAPEPRRQLLPNVTTQDTIEEEFATHVYEFTIPEFSYCGLYLQNDAAGADVNYEVYRPEYPGTPWWDRSPALYSDYLAIPYTFAAAPLFIVVHDEQQRGGTGIDYLLSSDCDLLQPKPLLPGAVLAGEVVGGGDIGYSSFFVAEPPRWTISTYTMTPAESDPSLAVYNHTLYLYHEGPLDQLPDYLSLETDPGYGAAETLATTAGTRGRTLVEVSASFPNGDPDSEFSMARSDEPMPGGTVHENLSPLDIPENGAVVSSTIAVTGAPATASAMHVAVDISHPYSFELVVELVSPQGVSLHLANDDYTSGYYGQGRDLIAIFPDLAPTSSGNLPALASAGNPNGTWTLRISTSAGLAGQLKGWALTFE